MAAKNQIAVKKESLSVGQVIDRVKRFWAGLRPQQQIYLAIGIAVTLAVAAFLVKMIATPNYKPLMKGLEPADAQTITAQLAAKKIPYQVSPDGTSISVPADQVDAARLEVASHDTPHSGRIGFEIFDKVSWGQTEFDEKVNYQRALEGELERTIQTISNVKSARVHLVMATDSVFTDKERGAKASVTLKLKHGTLSREELLAISRLVSGAVDELKPTDVVIIDADSNQALGTGNITADGSDAMEQELSRRVVATLTPIVGSDRVHASVNVEYENGSSEETQEKYDPTVSATLTMQHSEELSGPGVGPGGVPGTSSNVPSAKPAASPTKESGQSSRSDNNTYGVNKVTRHSVLPAGGIRRLTAAVVIDDAVEHKQQNGKVVEIRHKRAPEELKVIEDLVQAAIGYNSTRGDVVSVQNLTFDRGDQIDPPAPTVAEKAKQALTEYATLIRYAVLLVLFLMVYLLMLRPIQKRALAAPPALPEPPPNADGTPVEIPATTPEQIETPDTNAILAQRALYLKKQLADFVQSEPESSTTAIRAWLREEAQ